MSEQPEIIRGYYRLHARIYDLTRWTFLLGRNEILRRLPLPADTENCLLEVGCGTGRNLKRLAIRFPKMQLIGVDVSKDMLEKASRATSPFSRRILLFERPYGPEPIAFPHRPDVVLFSYSLTMFNPGWEIAIQKAYEDLPEGGRIAVVDFHNTPSRWFAWWMGKNHVRMDGHLLPLLQSLFETELEHVRPAYLGLWRYVMYIGRKPARSAQ